MANPGLRHAFKSAKSDPVDTTLVGATKWNDRHYFLEDDGSTAAGTLGDLPYRGASGLETLLTGAQGVLTSAGSGNVPAWSMTPTLTGLTVTTITIGAVTIDATDAGYIDGQTPGTVTASKAIVVDANKDIATLRHLTISGNFVTGSTTLSEAELAVLDGVTGGTVTASKALVVDANKDLASLRNLTLTGALSIGSNVASGGNIRVANNTSILLARNAANSGDLYLIQTDSSNRLILGDDGTSGTTIPMIVVRATNQMVGFGGTTSSFPALKRSSAALHVRLADDSDYASLFAGTPVSMSGSFLFGGPGTIMRSGSGSPEGSITAVVGSIYLRADGGANTTLYVKESGAGNTGWVAK